MKQKIDYTEFVEQITSILPVLASVKPDQVYYRKDGELEGLTGDRVIVEKPAAGGGKGLQALRISDIYEEFIGGADMMEILKRLREAVAAADELLVVSPLEYVGDYDRIRTSLIVRPLNYERNRKTLEGMVYKRIDGIALGVYIALGEVKGTFSSCKVGERMAEQWNKSFDEIYQKALTNTYLLYPPRICGWQYLERLSSGSDYGNFMNLFQTFPLSRGPGGNLLTTTNKLNGAVAPFLPGVARRLGDLMGEDYLVAFTSIHEAMIHSLKTTSAAMIREVLADLNRKVVGEAEHLTDDIYRYIRKEDRLERLR